MDRPHRDSATLCRDDAGNRRWYSRQWSDVHGVQQQSAGVRVFLASGSFGHGLRRPRVIAAIDVTHLRQSRGGIARYIRGLLGALLEREDLRVVPIGEGPEETAGTLRKKLLTARLDLAWYPFLGRRIARSERADVYHCPAPRGPLNRGVPPVVMTIHDLVPFRFPETKIGRASCRERV